MLTDDELSAMQQVASRSWTRAARHHPGQLAWSARYAEGLDHGPLRLWDDAWAWFEDPGQVELCAPPERAAEVVAWAVAAAPDGAAVTAMVLASETHLLDALTAAGFVAGGDDWWFTHHHLDLADLPPVPAVPGYRFRHVEPDEHAERAACHRRAWESVRVTSAAYERLMRTPPYRPGLDWVAVADDGTWAGAVCVWLDAATGVALVEPVGVAEEHGRRGLARAVSIAALAAARDAGATEALVCPRGDDGYPVPQALYRSIGFRPGERTVTLTLAATRAAGL